MNYTTNYHLPQWVESDRIMMEDFNEAMEAIDTGVAAAQTAAESAQSKADAAQSAAGSAYTPDNKPYVVGSYTGDGSSTARHFNLGFKPSFLIIGGQNGSYTEGNETLYRLAIVGGPWSASVATLENTGFYVSGESSSDMKMKPRLNVNNYRYYYIAFR